METQKSKIFMLQRRNEQMLPLLFDQLNSIITNEDFHFLDFTISNKINFALYSLQNRRYSKLRVLRTHSFIQLRVHYSSCNRICVNYCWNYVHYEFATAKNGWSHR